MKSPLGNLYKRAQFKIFTGDLHRSVRVVMTPKGEGFYTDAGLEKCCETLSGELKQKFPESEFRFIPVGKGKFNVIPSKGNA